MIITNMRYGFTKNLGNYESCKVEIEGIPNDGQSADEVMTELKAYVAAQLPGPQNGAETSTSPAPKKTGNPRTKKADKLKAPGTMAEAMGMVDPITNGQDLATYYNACRDSHLSEASDFGDLSKRVAEKCQQLCEIGTPERAAIGAALKSEKLRRENA